MRSGFLPKLEISIGSTRIVCRRNGDTGAELTQVSIADTSAEQLAAGFDHVLAAAPHRRPLVRVVLDDTLCRLFIVTPPGNARTLADLKSAAAMRFKSLYDMTAADWRIEADWNSNAPFLACALQQPLLAGIVQSAVKRRATLVEIAPHFVLAWNRWQADLKAGAWFGTVREASLTLAPIETAGVQAIRSLPVATCPDISALVHHVQREALRLGIAAPGRIQLCGDRPAEWSVGTIEGIDVQWLDQQTGHARRPLQLQQGGAS